MRERPILFSAPMVRAILAGKKTQTRRIVKPRDIAWHRGCGEKDFETIGGFREKLAYLTKFPGVSVGILKDRYGIPGDRLWVRECWGLFDSQPSDGPDRAHVFYRATDGDRRDLRYQLWRPSIHMPRWASRITLEVVAVRVERLQEISRVDAIAEGAPESHPSIDRVSMDFGFPDFSRSWFAQLWQEINGPESWSANPWVWVVEFKRLEA